MNHYKKLRLSADKTMDEHRYKMQVHLGRTLGYNEIVHHDDEIKSNNDLGNLVLISRSEHSRMHALKNVITEDQKDRLRNMGRQFRNGAKLSPEQVIEVRNEILAGTKQSDLAARFDVNKSVISKINTGRNSKHIFTLLIILLALTSCSVAHHGQGCVQTKWYSSAWHYSSKMKH